MKNLQLDDKAWEKVQAIKQFYADYNDVVLGEDDKLYAIKLDEGGNIETLATLDGVHVGLIHLVVASLTLDLRNMSLRNYDNELGKDSW